MRRWPVLLVAYFFVVIIFFQALIILQLAQTKFPGTLIEYLVAPLAAGLMAWLSFNILRSAHSGDDSSE